MEKIPGEFVPLDIHYYLDPAVQRSGSAAELLYIRSLAYAKSSDSDGFVSAYVIKAFSIGLRMVRKSIDALVRENLWTEVEGGWQITNWHKWNKTKAQVRAEKEARKASAILANHQRWHVGSGKKDPSCPHCKPSDSDPIRIQEIEVEVETEVETEPEVEPEPQLLILNNPPGARAVARRNQSDHEANAQTLIGEWIDHCGERPPSRLIGQVARELKTLLADGIAYDDVRRGFAAWHMKGLHPSALASVVHEVRTAPQRAVATGTTRAMDAIEIGRQMQAAADAKEAS